MLYAILLLGVAPVALPVDLNKTVQVGEHRYRVRVEGRKFTVFQKRAKARNDPELGLEMKDAVRQVTGCEPTEVFWQTGRLRGLLDCRA